MFASDNLCLSQGEYHRARYLVNGGDRDHGQLGQAMEDVVRGFSSPILVAAHQLESVCTLVFFDVLDDIPLS